MLQGLIVLAVIAVALLRGGSLRHFAAVRLRAVPLVFASLALQLLIFNPVADQRLGTLVTGALYVLSMGLLVVWVALNRSVPGMALIAAGVLMNTAAIAANGGYMPVDPQAAQYAGRLAQYPTEGMPVANNSMAIAEGVRLWLFTDIFPLPAGIPLANVFSLGDVFLTTGIAVFCFSVIAGHGGGAHTPVSARESLDQPLEPAA